MSGLQGQEHSDRHHLTGSLSVISTKDNWKSDIGAGLTSCSMVAKNDPERWFGWLNLRQEADISRKEDAAASRLRGSSGTSSTRDGWCPEDVYDMNPYSYY